MASEKILVITAILMMIVTIIPRVFPMFIDSKHIPKILKEALEFLPVSIVASIVVPPLILNNYNAYFLTPEAITALFATAITIYRKNLILTVVSSLMIFFILKKYLL